MALRPLNNDDWLYDSNCFVCETSNDDGLQIPFFADDDNGQVIADFSLGEQFSGAPSLLHGGVTLGVLDEAQAWATIALAHRFALTSETRCRFVEPVFVGHDYRATGRIVEVDDSCIKTIGEIRDQADKLCSESESTFVILSEAKLRDVIKPDTPPVKHRDYLRSNQH